MKKLVLICLIITITFSIINVFATDAGTYTQKLEKGDVYGVSCSTLGHYSSGNLLNCVVYMRLPLPKLSENQTITDYKLSFYTKNNSLPTGYTMGAFKLLNGAELIANGTGFSGIDDRKAVKKFYETYPTNGILDALIYNEKGNVDDPKTVKLTSYYHEIENDNNGEMYVAFSILQPYGIAINMSKPVNVEYTVIDKTDVSGYGIYDIKFVPEACDHYNAVGVKEPAAGEAYRAVVKGYNYESVSKNINLYLAAYENGELVSLTPMPATLNPYDEDIMILSDAFTTPTSGKKMKAFVWNEDGITPLIKETQVYTVAVEQE